MSQFLYDTRMNLESGPLYIFFLLEYKKKEIIFETLVLHLALQDLRGYGGDNANDYPFRRVLSRLWCVHWT